MIAGKQLTVNQTGLNCTYNLDSPPAGLGYNGGPVTVNVNSFPGCTWNVNPGPSWIQVTGPTPLPGIGSGPVNLLIAQNSTTTGRQASVQIGNQYLQITQSGVPCSFSLSANNPTQPAGGGSGSVDINTNPGCTWTASASAGFVTPAVTNGSGPMTLNFTVGQNQTGLPRSANLTIVGQSIQVNQNGPVCSYNLVSSPANVPGGGAPSASVAVNTAAGCMWDASSNATWLHITSTGPYNGAVSATYSADANLTGADRFGTLTVAGQPYSVTQPALVCPVALSAPSQPFGEFGGNNGQFTFTTTPPGCNVNIQSFTSWITLGSLIPAGTVNFSVDVNTFAAPRSGSIMVGDQTFTVNQAASSCAYTLTSFASMFSRNGGDGTVPMTFTPAQCGAPPVIVNGPASMITLGPVTSGPGTYTQNFNVGIYLSFINYVRTAQLLINGQIYTVKQTSW